MAENQQYYEYLKTRSVLARYYRNYYLYPYLNRYLNGTVLDVGCGIGDFLRYRNNTIGIDINVQLVEHCKIQGLTACSFVNDKIPFNDEYFDGVLLDNVIEHIENPTELLIEIKRALKQKGVLIIGVPGEKGYKADNDHKVFYDETILINKLSYFGFQKTKSFYMPLFKSKFLSRYLSQYCLYTVFCVL